MKTKRLTKRDRARIAEFVRLGWEAGLVGEEDYAALDVALARVKTERGQRRAAYRWCRDTAARIVEKGLNILDNRKATQTPSEN
jgi:hypothetical protein